MKCCVKAAWPRRRLGGRGFTLIELLVAAALLAVLAVLAWRGLDTVLGARQRLVAASSDLRAVTLALAQFDEDLRRSGAVRALALTEPAIAFAVVGERADVSVHLVRETGGDQEPIRLQAVQWRVRDGVLERGFGPGRAARDWAAVTGGGAIKAESWTWQPVVDGVRSWEVQAWLSDGPGWVRAESLPGRLVGPGAMPDQAAPTLVQGISVRLVRADGTRITRVLPVKD
jgi:general secretion pathway protein J